MGYIRDMNHSTEALHEPVYLKGEADGIQVEVAFQYTNEFRENVLGFCNNIYNAEGGTHLTGFKTTFTTVMNTYEMCIRDRYWINYSILPAAAFSVIMRHRRIREKCSTNVSVTESVI